MTDKRSTLHNAERKYRQQLLSGWSDYGKPADRDSDSKEVEPREIIPTKRFIKSKSHKVFVPIIIEEISNDGTQYFHRISVDANGNLPITAYSPRSKETSKDALTIPAEGNGKRGEISMVYGVPEEGGAALSHTPGSDVREAAAYIYSKILVTVSRAIEYKLYQLERQKREDDTRGSIPATSQAAHIPTDTVKGRGKAIRAKIRSEITPEVSAGMDKANGQVLGGGLPDNPPKSIRVGNVTINREAA